ncbi:MAG: hypothetical protein GY716_13895 [bacterium]|nr:hypothetical protein [bacterium]
MLVVAAVLIALSSAPTSVEESESDSMAWERRYDWYQAGVAVTRSEDAGGETLRGLRATWGAGECNMGGGLFLAAERSDDVSLYEAGLQLRTPFICSRYVDIAPRVSLGLEYVDGEPDEGLGVLGGIGLEAGAWLGDRVEFVVFFDREFGFSSRTRNQFGFALRVGVARAPLLTASES